MVYSYFPVLVNKNPTYKSELDILHFYQVWISVEIQQKNKENPSLIQLGNLGIFPVLVHEVQEPLKIHKLSSSQFFPIIIHTCMVL